MPSSNSKWLSLLGILSLITALLLIPLLFLIYYSSLANERRLIRIEQLLLQKEEGKESLSRNAITPQAFNPRSLLVDDPYLTHYLPSKRYGKKPEGEYRYAFLGAPQALSPLASWAHENEWQSLCQGNLGQYTTGSFETFSPDLAISIELRDDATKETAEYLVTLREGISWEPLNLACFSCPKKVSPHFLKRHAVTADDFIFFWKILLNPLIDDQAVVALRGQYAFIEAMQKIDLQHFVVSIKKIKLIDGKYVLPYTALQRIIGLRPVPSWLYLYSLEGEQIVPLEKVDTSSEFAKTYMTHFARSYIASCGPWIFEGLTQEGIQFSRNPNYYNPYVANWEKVRINFYNTFDAIYRDFQQKNIDICQVPRDKIAQIEELSRKEPLYLLRDQEPSYYYLGLNCNHPILKSKKVRQAVDLAVDKSRIISQVLHGEAMPLSGPYICTSTNMNPDIHPRPYNPLEAKKLLEEEGWKDRDGDGVVEKDIQGVITPLQFSILYYADSSIAKQVSELLSTQLRQIGVHAILKGVKLADLSSAVDDKSFDALFLGWVIPPPPEDFEGQWHSKYAHLKGSFNVVGFENEQVDQLLDQLVFEPNPQVRLDLYHRFHEKIADETPYLFLFSDIRTYAVWDWVENVFIPRQEQQLFPGSRDPVPKIYYSWKNSKRSQK